MLAEIVISVLLVIAGIFGLVGSFGLLKLPDTMTRLHAPTKATTIGVGSLLLASMAHAALVQGRASWHELLVTLFLLLTAPITANVIAKAHLHRKMVATDLPPTGTGRPWATFDTDRPAEPVMTAAPPPAKR